jgi:pSer/pThr/pTyr-binding forkhead associated (FHA) protein
MPITLLVRTGESQSPDGQAPRLTFDAIPRCVIGRGASCDVRLPDPSVSHRHATIEARGADFVIVDEGSTNGTFVGNSRLSPRTSRILKSGDMIRVGRVWLEARFDVTPITRDVANATRDIALALVARAMANAGDDVTTRARIVEGHADDVGRTMPLADEGRAYVVGRAAECDLSLADPAASRDHVQVVRRGAVVLLRDRGSKNAAVLGDAPLASDRDTPWRTTQPLRVGKTTLALEEPVAAALSELESEADEALAPDEMPKAPPPPREPAAEPIAPPASSAPIVQAPEEPEPVAPPPSRKKGGWSATDFLVMLAALSVLGLSIAGLVWLLRG